MRLLVVILALAAAAAPASAQDRGVLGVLEGRQASPGGYFFNAQPGQPVTRVGVWGHVARPGVYDVGPDFDLQDVLSLAGVFNQATAAEGDLQLVLRVFRAGQERPIYSAPIPAVLGDAAVPPIEYGDVLTIEREGVARVGVWGAVARPGVYEVGPSFATAQEALSLAGGPVLPAPRPSERRSATVLIYSGDPERPRYEATLDEFLSGPPPALSDGDVIRVETAVESEWTFRDTLTVAGVITSAAFTVTQIIRLIQQ